MNTINLLYHSIYYGDLILVNPKYPLHYKVSETDLFPAFVKQCDILLKRNVVTYLKKLIGILSNTNKIVAVSGYRTYSEQKKIFSDSLSANGSDFTKKFVAVPNHSEHQTGLAIDLAENKKNIDFIRPDFPYTGIFNDFRKAAPYFGFIERYPKDSEYITNISWEPWHFRYIGYPHSLIITENHFTLEEYIEYLKQFIFGKNNMNYQTSQFEFKISYLEANKSITSFTLPDTLDFHISGNNIDGFIITSWRKKND